MPSFSWLENIVSTHGFAATYQRPAIVPGCLNMVIGTARIHPRPDDRQLIGAD